MTKIYEALEHASRERGKFLPQADIFLYEESSSKAFKLTMEEEMLCLYKTIESLLPHPSGRIIQFISSRRGEGTSTIVRELAVVAALKIGKSVLLLDADRLHPSQDQYFSIQSENGWQDAVKNHELILKTLYQVENSPLFVSPSSNSHSSTPEIFDSLTFQNYWKNLGERFDLILVDSPPLASSPDGLAIAPKVDGVILVLEAEKTHWKVAESLKEKIVKVDGNVLGIVFNKRRYYIPQSIYERL